MKKSFTVQIGVDMAGQPILHEVLVPVDNFVQGVKSNTNEKLLCKGYKETRNVQTQNK